MIRVVQKYEEDGTYYANVIYTDTGQEVLITISVIDYVMLPVGVTIPFLIKGV